MSLERLLSDIVIQRIGCWLMYFTWQVCLIALAMGIVLFVSKKASAQFRYTLCCGALVLMIALPVGTLIIADNPPHFRPVALISGPASPVEVRDIYWDKVKIGTQYRTQSATLTSLNAVLHYYETHLPMIVLGWISGILMLTAYRLAGFINLRNRIRAVHSSLESEWEYRIQALIQRLNIKQKVRIIKSTMVGVPAVIGWMRPVLLVPVSFFTGMNPRYVESIIIHELAHVRRYDYLVNLVQMVVETVGFFHPAVWWLSGRIRLEREHCCDDWAVRVLGDPLIYVKSLVHLEETRRHAFVLAANGSGLVRRISRILNHPVRRSPSVPAYSFVFSLGILFLLLFSGFTRVSQTEGKTAATGTDLSRSLAAYYPFNGNVRDESGFNQNGVVKNAVLTEDRNGRSKSAYDFNGINCLISVPKTDALNTGGSVTASCWIYPRQSGKYQAWISRANSKVNTSQWRAGFGENQNTEWGITEYNSEETGNLWTDYWITRAEIPLGVWTHVTAVADQESHQVILYVNGQKVGRFEDLKPFEKSDAQLLIGYQKDDHVFFNGKIDDIRIYNRALNDQEVLAVYRMK